MQGKCKTFRKFGAGRSDDFSYKGEWLDKAWTMDDGTTTIEVNHQARLLDVWNRLCTPAKPAEDSISYTFVGTGVDIRYDGKALPQDQERSKNGLYSTLSKLGIPRPVNSKMVSGLPYGTHHVRATKNGIYVDGVQI